MNSLLNGPLQFPLPALSPFLTSRPNFTSPFVSPYIGSQNNHSLIENQPLQKDELDDFADFDLNRVDKPEWNDKSEQQNQQIIKEEQKTKKQNKDQEDQLDQSVQSEEDCETSQKIKRIINLLVKHVDKGDDKLYVEKMKCVADDKELSQIFDVLARKFKKLKKTKQEMTKYCMRKAFKFLAEKHKRILEGKDTGDFLREYFEHMESQAFSVPFKKNSEEKTMNTNFLKKVFSSLTFASDYKQFLKNFSKLVEEDNYKKVKYLTSTIKAYLNGHSLKKLQTVKRLPWTQLILDKTIDLAHKLITHSPYHTQQNLEYKKPRKSSVQNERSNNNNNSISSNRKKSNFSLPQLSLSPPKISQRAFKRVD